MPDNRKKPIEPIIKVYDTTRDITIKFKRCSCFFKLSLVLDALPGMYYIEMYELDLCKKHKTAKIRNSLTSLIRDILKMDDEDNELAEIACWKDDVEEISKHFLNKISGNNAAKDITKQMEKM